MLFVSLWHLVLYCPLAHMVWHPSGIIRKTGVLDFAGNAHMVFHELLPVILMLFCLTHTYNSWYIQIESGNAAKYLTPLPSDN